jgi:hypothetical protein
LSLFPWSLPLFLFSLDEVSCSTSLTSLYHLLVPVSVWLFVVFSFG